ncbi:hypothetical protein FOZ63_030303 [Perkinsus olseni]|uniref:Uncharacterized protein n=1 Tax=Perkinsus olseni TaxID=32597 RepID=A0A7J6TKY1_PEROL|nr:hypothetical protein FOZ63_030303 [Perkinsus olseni]
MCAGASMYRMYAELALDGIYERCKSITGDRGYVHKLRSFLSTYVDTGSHARVDGAARACLDHLLPVQELHPHTGYVACILCNKAPSSRLKISEHPSGGYRSAKQYQHFYYFQGRPAALSNTKCVQNSQWVNYWRSLYNARFSLTQTAFTHLRPEVERSLRDVATRLGYRLEQDLRSITISPPDIPSRESVNLSTIYHRDFSEDSENPTVSAEYLGTTDDDDYECASESVAGSGTVSSARVPEFLNLSQPLASLTNPRVSSSSSSTRRVSTAESTEARPGLSPEDARSKLRQLQEEISELERSMERIERELCRVNWPCEVERSTLLRSAEKNLEDWSNTCGAYWTFA